MEIRKKISGSPFRHIVEGLFFIAMFVLPWINNFHASTFLFITIGGLLLLARAMFINYFWYKKQSLFLLFIGYYLMLVVALCIYPHDPYAHADIERKASMLFIPILLYILTVKYHNIWYIGINGFVYGNVVATLFCFITASVRYMIAKSTVVFFYHEYAHAIGLSAIYFSLYLLVALGYIVLNFSSFKKTFLIRFLAIFLYINLLLLSSKILIIAGTFLLIIPILRSLRSMLKKTAIFLIALFVCIIIAYTGNPIKKRYADINIHNDSSVLIANNFSNFSFDGLSIRLLLWRLGNQIINEKRTWLLGAGGERYHEVLNDKIKQFRLYVGNPATADTGYQNYNMHDQYMESYLQFGIAGLLLLIGMLACAIYHAVYFLNSFLLYVSLLFLIAFITESVLETQAGILLFIIIISGEWTRSQKKSKATLN